MLHVSNNLSNSSGEKYYCERAKFGKTLVIMNLGEGYRGEVCLFVLVLFLQIFLKIEIITK